MITNEEFELVKNHVFGDAVTASRIIAGALWLDEVDRTWWNLIDLNDFEMNNTGRCVLGQVVKGKCNKKDMSDVVFCEEGEYSGNLEREHNRSAVQSPFALTMAQAGAMGFHLLENERDDWTTLMNRGWYALIAHRQDQQNTVNPDYDEDDE